MKNKSFRFLWVGQAFANLGDIFYVVGLISFIYAVTGSAFYLSLLPFTTTIFRFISSLLAPLVIDKLSLKRIIVESQWWKTILLIILGITLHFSQGSAIVVICFIAAISLLDGVAAPVSAALVPQLVPTEERMKANGFLNILTQTIFLAGWPIGSLLLINTNSQFIIWLTVIFYAVSTGFAVKIEVLSEQTTEDTHRSSWDSIKSGWLAIRQIPTIRTLISLDFITSLASSVWVAAVIYVYVEQNLQLGEEWWGYINTSYFIGMIFSGLIVIRFARFIEKHTRHFIIIGLLLNSLLILFFGLTTMPALSLLLACLYGLPEQIRDVIYTKLFQDYASEKTLAKIYAVWGAVLNLTFAGSVLLLGYITETYSVKTTFQFSSALVFLAFIYAVYKRKDLRRKVM
ncbi:MFS transporter [Peribacillus muralis]|uniref:MFS transporter n=1 Tax=Peribacillus muralis TaxID=264697 RepID=UPI003671DD45